jgi:NADH dehydrogenase FAD-containing subunit
MPSANSSATTSTSSPLPGAPVTLLVSHASTHPPPRSVTEVSPTVVRYTVKDARTGEVAHHEIPANFVLWSTGIAMNPFTARVSNLLPNQVHRKAIEVDAHLRVKGSPLGTVYAIGDCSTVCALCFREAERRR